MKTIFQKDEIVLQLHSLGSENNLYIIAKIIDKNKQHNITTIQAKNDKEAIDILSKIMKIK